MPKPDKNIVFYFLSLIYGVVTGIRNKMFDWGILKSKSFDLPVICIGNLAVGGTGKTPHTEFLIKTLRDIFNIAVLSRGYLRETHGFVLANENCSAKTIGDEPFQIYSKFPKVTVAVSEKRVYGIEQILKQFPEKEVIILDDAFQHRYVKAGLCILLTNYSNLYVNDYMLPYGTLREWKHNSRRADIIIVTKCPTDIQQDELKAIESKLNPEQRQNLFFSGFEYGDIYSVFQEQNSFTNYEMNKETTVLLITGIVNPEPIVEYLLHFSGKIETIFFPDHHDFTKNDSVEIENKFGKIKGNKIIITTEKDAARLKSNIFITNTIKKNTYALPLDVKILNNEQTIFTQKIEDYVRKNSGNR
ncbi:MAG: tetraacyldisaccharide 4'-kinase [Paludibacteraceae bacterium]